MAFFWRSVCEGLQECFCCSLPLQSPDTSLFFFFPACAHSPKGAFSSLHSFSPDNTVFWMLPPLVMLTHSSFLCYSDFRSILVLQLGSHFLLPLSFSQTSLAFHSLEVGTWKIACWGLAFVFLHRWFKCRHSLSSHSTGIGFHVFPLALRVVLHWVLEAMLKDQNLSSCYYFDFQ